MILAGLRVCATTPEAKFLLDNRSEEKLSLVELGLLLPHCSGNSALAPYPLPVAMP
jgi:hypothetical protein